MVQTIADALRAIPCKAVQKVPDRVIAEIKARYTISDDPIENEEYD